MRRTLAILLVLFGVADAKGGKRPAPQPPMDKDIKVWVHAPAEDLLGLYPGKGAGYLISIEEYQKLVALAQKTQEERAGRPPLAARLVHGLATARLDGDLLRVEASYVAVVKGDRPAEVPFPLSGIALERIDVTGGEFAGSSLRFSKAGTYNVTASLSVKLDKQGELLKTAFRLPPAAGHTLAIDMPAAMEGEVGPIVRAFKTGASRDAVVGYPDRTGLFSLWVRPRAEARKLDPLLSVSFDSVAVLGEARTVVHTKLSLEVLRSPMREVDLLLSPGQTIRGLLGKKIKTWRVERGGAADTLKITFVEPVQGVQTIELQAELAREEAAAAEVAIPVTRLPRAVRYRGTIGLVAEPQVRVTEIRAEGARRLDRLPKGFISVHEVWSPQPRVTVRVERVATKTRAFTRALLVFSEGGKRLRANFHYSIAGKPLFRLEPRLPAGWILRQVLLDGHPYDHRHHEDGRLVLVFAAGLKPGQHQLSVALDTDEVDWVPNDETAAVDFAGLRSGLDEERGYFVVAADPAFRVSTGATNGLEVVGMPEVRAAGFQVSERVLYAWRFDEPTYAASFRLERHRPQISAVVVNRVMPSERLLRSHATIDVKIERTGVRELKIALPKGTGRLVDFDGPLIKEKRHPADGADPEVWTIVFQKRIRGSYRLDVSFDRKFDEDAWTAPIPPIAVPEAQERGFVVVHSSATTAIGVQRNGLREADVGELPSQPRRAPLEVLAYAKQPYTVTLSSRRHDPHAVVQAVALSAHIYGVLTTEGWLRCRAEYRVRNNDQAFLGFSLPADSRLVGALVDGQPAKPLVEKGLMKLPLARSRNREAPFLVAIIYESRIEALERSGEVTLARPSLDVDVLKTRYALHLPGGYELTGHDGDLVPTSVPEQETVLGGIVSAIQPFPVGATRADAEDAPATEEAAPPRPKAPPKKARFSTELKNKQTKSESWQGKEDLTKSKKSRERSKDAVRKERRSKAVELRRKEKGVAADKKMIDEEVVERQIETEEIADRDEVDADSEFEDSAGEEGLSDAPFTGPSDNSAIGLGGGKRGRVAHGRPQRPTPQAEGKPAPRRKRPERALLSLDVQFLRSDNVVRLDSLAPTGSVTLSYARVEVFDRYHYVGIVLGAAAGLFALVAGFGLLRLCVAGVLVVLFLHFGGVSFLSADFARGAAAAILVALGIAILPRLVKLLVSIRLPSRKAGGTTGALLLLAAFARSEEEVYVPYSGDDIEKVDRVFLPAKEYHRLRKLAYPEDAERATAFVSAQYTAELKGEQVTLGVRYMITKESAASERIPLRLNNVAVTSAQLDGEAATLNVDKSGGYILVLTGKGKRILDLVLRPKLEGSGERRWFRVMVRPVARATMQITHDRTGHEVKPVSLGAPAEAVHQIGPVAVVGATWMPKTESFRAAAAELRAHTEAVVFIRDGYTAVAARVRYGISGGKADRFRIRLDRNLVVRSVGCAHLAGWEITNGVLVVALGKPVENSQIIEIRAERPARRERTGAFPEIAPLDVLRDAGVLAIETLPDLKVEVLETQGLLRAREGQAPRNLSAAHDKGVIQSVHRFAVRPFRLTWRVFLEATRMRAETDLEVRVERQAAFAVAKIKVDVERGPGLFGLQVTVPAGYEVVTASGRLRDWWVDDGVLNLARLKRQTGSETYTVILRRTGATAEAFEAPVLSVRGAARESGLVRVAVADGLELDAREASNLLPEDIAKLPKVKGMHLRRAYRYVTMPWRLVLSTREETREVEALVVSRVIPLQDRVRVEALVNFYVRRGLVDELSFVVPGEGTPLVNATDLREELSEAVEGGRRYTLRLRTATRGTAAAAVTYHLPYGEALRGVEPLGAARVQRHVAVEKVPDGEVKITNLVNLESGDFDDLPLHPPETTSKSVAGVFEGTGGAFGIDVAVTRHTFEEVARAVIFRAAAKVVVDRSGWTRTQVTYRVYNRSEQFLNLELPDGARLYSVLVAGTGVRPLVSGKQLLVPLRKVAIGATTFDVDVVYAYLGPRVSDDDFDVRLPGVEGLEVRRTTLSLYVPKGYGYSFDTKMEEVEEADLAAGEADDTYQEIKDLYSVAERGNELQMRRAFSNIQRLEGEFKRQADKAQTVTRHGQVRQTVEQQKLALAVLRRANDANIRQSLKSVGKQPQPQGSKSQRQAEEWEVNVGYLARNFREDNRHLMDFKKKQESLRSLQTDVAEATIESFRGPTGGVPPGLREPADPRPPPAPQGRVSGTGGGGGASRGRASRRVQTAQLDAGKLLDNLEARYETATESRKSFADELQDFEVEVGQGAATGAVQFGRKLGLRGATGRISIRIDLPLQGEVFHFQRLGAEGGVSFSASEQESSWLQAILAVAFAGAAVIVLRARAAHG